MPFLNPLFLVGLLAAGIPILLHFLSQRNPRSIEFSTLRFLQQALAKVRRRQRITQFLLLLLRVLAVVCVVLAFAQPRLRYSRFLPPSGRNVVIVIDGSASTQAGLLGQSHFKKAQIWALRFLNTLDSNDRVALFIPGSRKRRRIFPGTMNHAVVKENILSAHAGFMRIDLANELLRLLREFGQNSQYRQCEVHVFSDFQKSSWPLDGLRENLKSTPWRGMTIFLNDTSEKDLENVRIADVELNLQPGSKQLSGIAKLRNYLDKTAKGLLHVRMGGKDVFTRGITIGAQATADVPFEVALPPQTGEREILGTLVYEKDNFEPDNRYAFVLRPQEHVRVLILGHEHGNDSRYATYYLERAINPSRAADNLLQPSIRSELSKDSDVKNIAMILLCTDSNGLEANTVNRLTSYVENGGTLVIYPDGDPGRYQKILNSFKSLKKLRVSLREYDVAREILVSTSPGRGGLMEKNLAGILKTGQFKISARRIFALDLSGMDLVEPCFQLETGSALLLRIPVGKGVIWLSALSPRRDYSSWPTHPLFVIFHQYLALEAVKKQIISNHLEVGEPLRIPVAMGLLRLGVKVTTPEGEIREYKLERRKIEEPFLLQAFPAPGHYRVQLEKTGEERNVAVVMPSAESELEHWSGAQLKDGMRPLRVYYARSIEEELQNLQYLTRGYPLWPWLLLAAFLFLLIEEIYANMRTAQQVSRKQVMRTGAASVPGHPGVRLD
ncbi:MAG: VWA domain-containing protein [Lentisphaerae bacterium]|nr:MAG: VWA domain-containing protein [Lentisphaerota bacterium]